MSIRMDRDYRNFLTTFCKEPVRELFTDSPANNYLRANAWGAKLLARSYIANTTCSSVANRALSVLWLDPAARLKRRMTSRKDLPYDEICALREFARDQFVRIYLEEWVQSAPPGENRAKARDALLAWVNAARDEEPRIDVIYCFIAWEASGREDVAIDFDIFSVTILPDCFDRLTHVTKLDLSGNELTFLPKSLGAMPALKALKVSYNLLTFLPNCIGKLHNLKKLDASYNLLTYLPPSVKKLALQKLRIKGNKWLNPSNMYRDPQKKMRAKEVQTKGVQLFKKTPEDYTYNLPLERNSSSFSYLEFLEMCANHTSYDQLRDHREHSRQLAQDYAEDHYSSDKANVFSKICALVGLDPESRLKRRITSLSSGELSRLTIYARHKFVKVVLDKWEQSAPPGEDRAKARAGLDAWVNSGSESEQRISTLFFIIKLGVYSASPDENAARAMVGFPARPEETGTEAHARWSRNNDYQKTFLERSVKIWAKGTLPDCFAQLAFVRVLDLSGNQLKSLPGSIGEMICLKELDLRLNKLKSLPDCIGELSDLEKLDVRDNLLTYLPQSIAKLALKQLRIKGNEWLNPSNMYQDPQEKTGAQKRSKKKTIKA